MTRGERRLPALKIPRAHLVVADHVEIDLTAALLDERGVATESVPVAHIVPLIVLKVLAPRPLAPLAVLVVAEELPARSPPLGAGTRASTR